MPEPVLRQRLLTAAAWAGGALAVGYPRVIRGYRGSVIRGQRPLPPIGQENFRPIPALLVMPRPPRFIVPGLPHHITQRGNYRQPTFLRASDYSLYRTLLKRYARHYGVAIQAYCLMPNHVHLVVVPQRAEALARMLQRLHSDYARAIHLRLGQNGHLWQARYFSVPMDVEHFWATMVYVEQNPQRARLREHCWDWKWSSARAHLAGDDDEFLDLEPWRKQYTPERWRSILELGLADAALVERIRESTRYGWPLGSESFLDRLAEQLRRPTRRGAPGAKPTPVASTVSAG